jgi:WD40 repeat protein
MKPCSTCPTPDELRALAAGQVAGEDQSRLVEHLDACSGCQGVLEEACSATEMCRALLHIDRRQPAAGSAYWQALERLCPRSAFENALTRVDPTSDHVAVLLPEDVPLDFLSPPERSDHLGKLNHFEVLGLIGRGGMGIVLRGLDPCLQRPVAIKVLDPKLASNAMAWERFCREARTAASIAHENVVAVHQVDEDEKSGLPFLVMQMVAGESLEQRLARQGRLDLTEVVRIGMQAAAGLAAAHEKGLIHRDVKPGNILLEAGTRRVKLTDFGLARATEDVKLTRTGFVAGTPLYMSPEQARGEEVDARSDLFSLGVVLYELCTGQPPFTADTPLVLLRKLADDAHPPLRQGNPNVPDWLEEVIDRLLAKDPAQRYGSAAEVAQVLAGHLSRLEPLSSLVTAAIRATPLPAPAVRRGPARWKCWLVPAACLMLLAGTAGLAWLVWGPGGRAKPSGPAPLAVVPAGSGPVWSVAFSPDGKTLALGLDDGHVRLWDLEQDEVLATLKAHLGPVWCVAYEKKSGLLATASEDGTVQLWPPGARKPARVLEHKDAVRSVAFSPDSSLLVSGTRSNRRVRLWDVSTGQERQTLGQHDGMVVTVAFSPDGRVIASAGSDKVIKLWNIQTGLEQQTLEDHQGGVYSVAFGPKSRRLVSGGWGRSLRLWDARTGKLLGKWRGHSQDIWSVAFSPDGETLASGSEDHTVKLWDVETGKERVTFTRHTGTVYAVAFSPDGTRLASGGRDATVRIWDVGTGSR